MKIKNVVVVAFVALLKAVAEAYLPNFPISLDLINTVILALLALVGVDVVEFGLRNTRFGAFLK
jgi:hypothetical protein